MTGNLGERQQQVAPSRKYLPAGLSCLAIFGGGRTDTAMRRLLIALCTVAVLPAAQVSAGAAEYLRPAEQPPRSYSADRFVDSRGCPYARSASGKWLPVVTSQRVLRCNKTPTVVPVSVTVGARAVMPPGQAFRIPPGFKAAWTDDRLNPRRGQGTSSGEAAMNRVWSATVPRRLLPGAPNTFR